MHEQIARVLYHLQVHLLFASLVWVAAWVLTSIPRGSATTKYWIWVATALNFILPTGAILDKFGATHFSWATPLSVAGSVGLVLSQTSPVTVLCVVWLVGAGLMFTRLSSRLRYEHPVLQSNGEQSSCGNAPGFHAESVPVKFAANRLPPSVSGVLRAHISLPDGIDRLLSKDELTAVLIHELAHAKRRDNLIRLVYEVGLCLLWFHPLVWVAGRRLALYRELSCDESVIQSARGRDLVSALAKLANPEKAFLLQATASSFITDRLAQLTGPQRQAQSRLASALLVVGFGAVLLAGIFATVAHTACCWLGRV